MRMRPGGWRSRPTRRKPATTGPPGHDGATPSRRSGARLHRLRHPACFRGHDRGLFRVARTIDDIVDYLTFTFIPLLLVWRMGWLPEPAMVWIAPALLASLFGFANTAAKDEAGGFFLGFPSYWNVVAFYAGFAHHLYGPWVNAAMLLLLALLTVLPVRFLYPNLAPRPWRTPLIVGAFLWLGMMLWLLVDYPDAPALVGGLSVGYSRFFFWLFF